MKNFHSEKISCGSNQAFEKNTTYTNCDVRWTEWSLWYGDIPGSPTNVKYSGATVTISKTGKTATIEIINDGLVETYNKRLTTNGFYFKEIPLANTQ